MNFDIEGARQAGYSDAEIVAHLAGEQDFDLEGARQAGYSDSQILEELNGLSTAEEILDPVAATLGGVNRGIVRTVTRAPMNVADAVLSPFKAAAYHGGSALGFDMEQPDYWANTRAIDAAMDPVVNSPWVDGYKPQTKAGEYGHAAGNFVGEAVPFALAGGAPALVRGVSSPIVRKGAEKLFPALMEGMIEPFTQNAAKATAFELGSAATAGVGQQAVKDMGGGEGSQALGALFGGLTPGGLASLPRAARKGADVMKTRAALLGEDMKTLAELPIVQGPVHQELTDSMALPVREALDNINEADAMKQLVPDAEFTGSSAARDPGLASKERVMQTVDPARNQIMLNNNDSAVSKAYNDMVPEADSLPLQERVQADLDNRKAKATEAQDVVTPSEKPESLGRRIRADLEGQRKVVHDEADAAIEEAKRNISVPAKELTSTAKSINKKRFPTERGKDLPPEIGNVAAKDGKKLPKEWADGQVSGVEVNNIQNDITSRLNQMRQSGTTGGPAYERLKEFEGRLKDMMDQGDMRQAKELWREYKAVFHEQGVGNILAKDKYHTYKTGSEKVPDALIDSPETLDRVIAAAGSKKAAQRNVEQSLYTSYNRKVGADGAMTPEQARKWMRENDFVFQKYPEVKQKIQAAVDATADYVAHNKAFEKVTGRTIDNALDGINTPQLRKQLHAKVKNDPEALAALRRAAFEKIVGKNQSLPGALAKDDDTKYRFAKILKELNKPGTADTLKDFGYTAQEIKQMRGIASVGRRAEFSQSATQIKGRSNTAQDMKTTLGKGAKAFAMVKGAGSAVWDSALSFVDGILGKALPKYNERARDLLMERAMWDSDLLKTILMSGDKRASLITKRRLRAYLIPALNRKNSGDEPASGERSD